MSRRGKTSGKATATFLMVIGLALALACGGGGGGSDSVTTGTVSTGTGDTASDAALMAVDGQEFSYQVISSDSSREVISYSLIQAPDGMTIDQNGIISWQPVNQAGEYEVIVEITYGESSAIASEKVASNIVGDVETVTFTVIVAAQDSSVPVISSISNQTVEYGATMSLQVSVSGGTSPYTYALSKSPTGMTISSAGLISWAPGYTQLGGQYEVVVSATDSAGATATKSFNVTVPQLLLSVMTIPDQTYSVDGSAYSYNISATGTYGPFTYALVNSPSGMTVNSNGQITWSPSAVSAGQEFTVTAKVTDSKGNYKTASFTMTIENLPPAITLVSEEIRADSNVAFQYQIVATDNNTPLTYTLQEGPDWASISSEGKITGTPTSAGLFATKVRVADSNGAYSEMEFNIRVYNQGPTVDAIADQTATVALELQVQVVATDPAMPLVYSLANAPTGMTIDSAGLIKWTPTANQGGLNFSNVKVITADAFGAESVRYFAVTVNNVAPVIAAIPVQNPVPEELFTLQTSVTDNNTPFLYQLYNAPFGMTIDGNGKISWTPTNAAQHNQWNVTVRVSDTHATNPLYSEKTFTLDVANGNPVVSAIPDQSVLFGDSLVFDASPYASDVDTPLTYAMTQGPVGMAMDSNTGVVTWTPSAAGGPHDVTFKVTDSLGAYISGSFKVTAAEGFDSLTIVSPVAGDVTHLYVPIVFWPKGSTGYGPLDFTIQFTVDGGTNYYDCTPASYGVSKTGLKATPTGSHTFVWDSKTDFATLNTSDGYDSYSSVKVKIVLASESQTVETGAFKVFNKGMPLEGWPKELGPDPGNTCRSLYQGPDYSGSVASVQRWIRSDLWQNHAAPIIGSDGTIYAVGYTATDGHGLYALNPEDGSKKWFLANQVAANWSYTSPALTSDGTLYVCFTDAAVNGRLYAVNASDGSLKWSGNRFIGTHNNYCNSPNVDPLYGTIYLAGRNSTGYAYGVTDNGPGTAPTDKFAPVSSGYAYDPHGMPAIDLKNDAVLLNVTYYRTSMLSLKRSDGAQRWTWYESRYVYASPTIYNGYHIYALQSRLARYRTTDNGGGWDIYNTYADVRNNSAAVGYNEVLYVTQNNNYLYALTSTGAQKWSHNLGRATKYPAPCIGKDNIIYMIASDYIYAVADDGSSASNKWWTPIGANMSGYIISLAMGGDANLYVAGQTAYGLRCFGPDTAAVQILTPGSVVNAVDTPIRIHGGGFTTTAGGGGPATEVKLKKGATEVVLAPFTVDSYSTIRTTVPAGLEEGEWDVIITTPNGTNTSSAAKLTVTK